MNRSTVLAATGLGLMSLTAACGSTATRSGTAATSAQTTSATSANSASRSVTSAAGATIAAGVGADPNIDPQFCVLVKRYAADSATFGNSSTSDEFRTRLPIVVKELTEIAAASPASVKADVAAAAQAMTHLDAALASVGYDPAKITDNTAVQAATVELSGVDEKKFDDVAKANCGISLNGGSASSTAGTTPAS